MKLQIAALALIAAAAAPAFAAPATFRGLQDACAAEGDRALECPNVDNPTRPALCCEGLVCSGPRCVTPDSCAAEGQKAIECGIAQVNRPAECCPGLQCNALKFCTVDGEGLPEEPEEPEDDLPDTTPEPTPAATDMASEEESETFEDTGEPTAAPVMMTTLPEVEEPPMPETLPTDCGLIGAKTEQCGADAKPGRFAECCPGLICDPDLRLCAEGESKPPTPAPQCGVLGDKTEQCGADAKVGRWAECCPGLDCDLTLRECIPGPPTAMPTGMPTVAVTEMDKDMEGGMLGTSYCTFSPNYDCYESGWPACCGDDAVECPEEQPGCDPVSGGETSEPTMGETAEPTMGETAEPTMADTGAPTMGEDGPTTSGAVVLVTGFATVGAVVAPLLLL